MNSPNPLVVGLAPFLKSSARAAIFLFLLAVVCLPGILQGMGKEAQSQLDAISCMREASIKNELKPLDRILEQYKQALQQYKAQAQGIGELDGVLTADKALESLNQGSAFSPLSADPKIAQIQKAHQKAHDELKKQLDVRLVDVEREYSKQLEKMVKELTKAGMLEDAVEVRKIREKFIEDFKSSRIVSPPPAKSIATKSAKFEERKAGEERNFEIAPGFKTTMCWIPPGEFLMGSSVNAVRNVPEHAVYVSAFYMAKNLVTKSEWHTVRMWGMTHGYTDLATGAGKASNHPVQSITWYDAVKWCNALSEMERLTPCYMLSGEIYRTGNSDAPICIWSANGYRLPTDAEWEKAARGGLQGKRFPWGDTISHREANYNHNGGERYQTGPPGYDPVWGRGERPYTSPVGSYPANGYGLCDMAGNVSEWCWDWFGTYTAEAQTDPHGPSAGRCRLARGGDWSNGAWASCIENRIGNTNPSNGGSTYRGFRIARISVQ